jgi:hypothetical protein
VHGLSAHGGAGKKTGDACSGYAFVWERGHFHDPPKGVFRSGKLECNVCYQEVKQRGVPKAPCRGIDANGKMDDGIWVCAKP